MLGSKGYHIAVIADRVILAIVVVGVGQRIALGKVAVATGLWRKAGGILPHVAGGSGESAECAIGVAGAVKIMCAGVILAGGEE